MDISFASKLEAMGACGDAVKWVGDRDLSTAWEECEHPGWMLWLAGRMAGKDGWSDRRAIILVAADIAESVLHLVREQERSVCQKAIQAARDFANGLIDSDAAADAAAYAAARAAYDAAAYAVYAAYAAARAAADAAAYAARAAAYAALAAAAAADAVDAADAALAAAYAAADKRKEICGLIRTRITVGTI